MEKPLEDNLIAATYADDTAIFLSNELIIEASGVLERYLDAIEKWLIKWNIKVNSQKSVRVTFALRKGDRPTRYLNGSSILKANKVKYFGLHLNRRLT